MKKYDLNQLTQEEREKLVTIVSMLKSNRPLEAPTEVLAEQIDFIRRHGENKLPFYSQNFYENNEKRTRAIYFATRKEYVRRFNIHQKKIKNATTTFTRLMQKAEVVAKTV